MPRSAFNVEIPFLYDSGYLSEENVRRVNLAIETADLRNGKIIDLPTYRQGQGLKGDVVVYLGELCKTDQGVTDSYKMCHEGIGNVRLDSKGDTELDVLLEHASARINGRPIWIY